jgi:serine/threonine protein kinase
LIIISTPYREGTHVATYPKYFIPIIDHLIALHKAGFLHGDIRAYNTVIHNENAGWLIDFDYGGKISDRPKYPDGYRDALTDGHRIGSSTANEEMLPWHDWYALGHLIFFIHMLKYDWNKMSVHQDNILITKSDSSYLKDFWLSVKQYPDMTEIDQLKDFLRRDDFNEDGSYWIYECQLPAQPQPQEHKTLPGVTGNPLKK